MSYIVLRGFKDDNETDLEITLSSWTEAEAGIHLGTEVTIHVHPETNANGQEPGWDTCIDLKTAQARTLAHVLLVMADDAERRNRDEMIPDAGKRSRHDDRS